MDRLKDETPVATTPEGYQQSEGSVKGKQTNDGVCHYQCRFQHLSALICSNQCLTCTKKYIDHLFLHSPYLSEVCKSPTELPKFEWINKYQKSGKSQGVVKQALAPLGTTLYKHSQQQKTGLWYFSSLTQKSSSFPVKLKL